MQVRLLLVILPCLYSFQPGPARRRMSDDPFAMFGNDEEDEPVTSRDASNGPLVFRDGTEQSLLAYVQNNMDPSESDRQTRVLELVDEFCTQRHWMMHVGPEKALPLADHLRKCVASRKSRDSFNLVELGTYCGYSSIRMASILMQEGVENFTIHTVDVNPQFQSVAREMIRLAGIEQHMNFVLLDETKTLAEALPKHVADFVFLDHAKEAYLSDLRKLENGGLIGKGTYVAADNVVSLDWRTIGVTCKHCRTKGSWRLAS